MFSPFSGELKTGGESEDREYHEVACDTVKKIERKTAEKFKRRGRNEDNPRSFYGNTKQRKKRQKEERNLLTKCSGSRTGLAENAFTSFLEV